jgi:hypothetical protein
MLRKVFAFDRWEDVLRHFGMRPVAVVVPPLPSHPIYDGAGGESKEHRELKEFVASHPAAIGLPRSSRLGELEFMFGSADAVDVLFQHRGEWVGVEVKSRRSATPDVARGLYQCVKYRALLEATQMVAQLPIRCRVVLALGGKLPTELIPLRNILGIEVCENVGSGSLPDDGYRA